MIHQPSFAQAEFATKKKVTRREKFLARMETLLPWTHLLAVIEPFYPKGERGRPPVGLERMAASLIIPLVQSSSEMKSAMSTTPCLSNTLHTNAVTFLKIGRNTRNSWNTYVFVQLFL